MDTKDATTAGDEKPDSQSEQNKFDLIESSLGIQTYMSPEVLGFTAVLKARYSDFVVHEVGEDGTMARLTSQALLDDDQPKEEPIVKPIPTEQPAVVVSIKKEEEAASKDKEPIATAGDSDSNNKDDSKDGNKDDTKKRKRDYFGWEGLKTELCELIKDPKVAETAITMLQKHTDGEPCEEKFVTLPLLEDKEQRKGIHQWIRQRMAKTARADTLDQHIRLWHVSFEKEMPNYKSFGSARNKRDKPSKKSWPADRPDFLKFTLYKENMDTTTATRDISWRARKARIGYGGMKDKRGITTQFCTIYRTEPKQIMQVARNAGGGNSKTKGYCVVELGNFSYVSKEIRLGSLKGNRFDIVLRNVKVDGSMQCQKNYLTKTAEALRSRGFINYFGTQRFGKFYDTHLVGIEAIKGNHRAAIDIIMKPKNGERRDILDLRETWQNRFSNDPEESKETEKACAQRLIQDLSRFMTAENSILQRLSREPKNYKRAFSVIPKTLRMMFFHAVQSMVWNKTASYRIEELSRDKVLVGDLVALPDTGEIHVVSQEDINANKFSLEDVTLPLVGTKTVFPENETGQKLRDNLNELGVTMEMINKIEDRDMRLAGDYRKLLCRPKDVDFSIVEYTDPLQPLLETDLMKLRGEPLVIGKDEDGDKTKLVGMTVGFTLPSSAYATIALRELMKRPTSTEFQRGLKLDS